MAIDKLGLYNAALRNCKNRSITLTENCEARRLLDRVWAEDPIKYCLEQGSWQFATRAVKMTYDPNQNPEFGYQYGFEKPADYVRTVSVCSDEYFRSPLNQFADEQKFIFTDLDEIYVKYVSDDEAYGRDYTRWSVTFQDYVGLYMGSKIVGKLTGSDDLEDRLMRRVAVMESKAQGIDGVNRPTAFPPRGTLVNARMGRRILSNDIRRR